MTLKEIENKKKFLYRLIALSIITFIFFFFSLIVYLFTKYPVFKIMLILFGIISTSFLFFPVLILNSLEFHEYNYRTKALLEEEDKML